MGDKVGYARVSTREQNLDSQLDQLKAVGCTKIFIDKASGVSANRPGWLELMGYVRSGDTVVVAELSRMSRSLLHFLSTVQELEKMGVQVESLRENIDPSTATGRAFMGFMGVIHQLELDLKAERAAAGRASAKARGKTGGRPRTDQDKLEQARILYENSEKTAVEVCKIAGVGRRTFFAYLAEAKAKAGITAAVI
ncbi:resolvase [Geomonas limicola]|uniref:Resolvase n=1 Tax=Geomonas limicola TaxID=2740186 RepID=A0A6V8N9U9_9BACT|nr:recombinase family protein [Geomonas limicola]GFO68587.1 resolvase [Geomonas limicola]